MRRDWSVLLTVLVLTQASPAYAGFVDEIKKFGADLGRGVKTTYDEFVETARETGSEVAGYVEVLSLIHI